MRRLILSLAIGLFAAPGLALAQQASTLERQMTAEEFKAAGLDKLSAAELANLNAWLERRVEARTRTAVDEAVAKATEQAREEGRKEVVQKNRGFFDFGSDEPIVSTIRGEFNGFGSGRKYQLDNDQLWEQIDAAQLSGVRKTNPKVTIKPGLLGVWWMKIDGYNTQAKVRRIK